MEVKSLPTDLDVVDSDQRGDHRIVVSRHGLLRRLSEARRVTVVAAPAGSGKTWLLRSWIAEARLEESVAWVSVERGEHDPTRFWTLVRDAIRATSAGSASVEEVRPTPHLEGGLLMERLADDLSSLDQRVLLVIDDLHDLRSPEAKRQLERFLSRAPTDVRFAISTRDDLPAGLHRLRLEGELTELRTGDLRFSLDEARALFQAAGVPISDPILAALHQRTEGWVAGLRLAALSLAGHPDPEGFAAEFSGSQRLLADYLLAEVLERQPEEVRELLLRTSVLKRVNGRLADLLTGGSRGEFHLQSLEEAGAFVVSLNAGRSWFRYHQLLADLLQLELRRTSPEEIPVLHRTAAGWFAANGHPIEAVRHAQAAEDWSFGVRLLSDHWFALWVTGRGATAHELLEGFPADQLAKEPELAALIAADELTRGWLDEAERQLVRATRGSPSAPPERRQRLHVWLTIGRLAAARRRGDLPAAVEAAERVLALVDAPDTPEPGLREQQRAVALIELGTAEAGTARTEDAERHLERALTLAQRSEQPFLEVTAMAQLARVALQSSFAGAAQRARHAVELARRHGWDDEPILGDAYTVLGLATVVRGRLDEGERWLDRAERSLPPDGQPPTEALLHLTRSLLELARGRDDDALAALRDGERLVQLLVEPRPFTRRMRAMELHTLVRLGEVQRAEAALDAMDEKERESPETRTTVAVLRLAQEDPEGAREALEPIIEDAVRGAYPRVLSTQVLLLSAIAGDAVRDPGASGRALESALDLAEADGVVVPFLLHPAPALLERHQRHHTSHASLVGEIRGLLAGRTPASLTGPEPLDEALSDSEMRVLRYLPSNLSAPEISDELYLSVSTIKTHIQHIYAKLGVHRRTEAVERARALGLLAPSSLGTHSPSPGARPAIHSNGMRTTHPRRSEPGPP